MNVDYHLASTQTHAHSQHRAAKQLVLLERVELSQAPSNTRAQGHFRSPLMNLDSARNIRAKRRTTCWITFGSPGQSWTCIGCNERGVNKGCCLAGDEGQFLLGQLNAAAEPPPPGHPHRLPAPLRASSRASHALRADRLNAH